MFIKYFDYLSPKITFYHKGNLSHSSIFSGILSIISVILIIIFTIYYIIDIAKRKNPNTFYINKYIEDAGEFQLNSSSLFHFVNFVSNIRGQIVEEELDFTIFNIIGSNAYIPNMKNFPNYLFNHWIYGYCNNTIFSKELNNLITYDFFGKSVCIQYYFNAKVNKYYKIGDPNFVWPKISHGTFNDKNIIYNLVIQKCDNLTILNLLGEGHRCKSDLEIDNYVQSIETKIVHFYFINNYINVLNYKNPFEKFLYRIETPLMQQYTSNELTINPALVKTNYGLIWDNTKEDISYIFKRNDMYIKSNLGKNIYISYVFLLNNMMHYYERTYKRIQDVISNIGGFFQFITIIAFYLNNLCSHFMILSDTEVLFNFSKCKEITNKNPNSNELVIIKNNMTDIEKDNRSIDIKYSQKKILNNSEIVNNENYKNDMNISSKNKCIEINNLKRPIFNNFESNKIKNNNKTDNSKNENEQINYLNYLFYKISCGKKMKFFHIYEKFRQKIFSEEQYVKDHLFINNLKKSSERKIP